MRKDRRKVTPVEAKRVLIVDEAEVVRTSVKKLNATMKSIEKKKGGSNIDTATAKNKNSEE